MEQQNGRKSFEQISQYYGKWYAKYDVVDNTVSFWLMFNHLVDILTTSVPTTSRNPGREHFEIIVEKYDIRIRARIERSFLVRDSQYLSRM